jgi:RimJ/RimL family protein N-acetyltransferase
MSNAFQNRALQNIRQLKQSPRHGLPIVSDGQVKGKLDPIINDDVEDEKVVKLLAKWREENSFAFPSQFTVTLPGTKSWLQKQLLENETRLLFLIKDEAGIPIGHIGLYSFDFAENSCEIDNVVRGEKNGHRGIMTMALETLLQWTNEVITPDTIFLRVFSDNQPAIKLYRRCHFIDHELIPLRKIEKDSGKFWEETNDKKLADKYFLKMKYQP